MSTERDINPASPFSAGQKHSAPGSASSEQPPLDPEFDALSLIQEDMRSIDRARHRAPLFALAVLVLYSVAVTLIPQRPELGHWMWQHALTCLALGSTGILAMILGTHLSELRLKVGLAVFSIVGLAFLGYAAFSQNVFEAAPEEGMNGINELICLRSGLILTLPVLGLTAWLLRSARLPTLVSSLMLGLGAGLMAVMVLHTHCPNTTPGHLLFSHGGVILLAMGAAALYGKWVSQRSFNEVASRVRARMKSPQ